MKSVIQQYMQRMTMDQLTVKEDERPEERIEE